MTVFVWFVRFLLGSLILPESIEQFYFALVGENIPSAFQTSSCVDIWRACLSLRVVENVLVDCFGTPHARDVRALQAALHGASKTNQQLFQQRCQPEQMALT